jgi:hypothetical protein
MISNRLRNEGGGFALGLLLGAVLGVTGVSLAPILIVVISVPLFVSLSALRATPPDSRRSAAGAGVLVGVGAVFIDGAVNTFVACRATEDFCGDANPVPLLALALLTLACGVVVSVLTVKRALE